MIERLLAADKALAEGHLDAAEKLFRQVADADGRNAIAVVGLGRVAQARGDGTTAAALAERALVIDPEDGAALRLRDETAVAGRAATPTGVAPAPATPASVSSAAQAPVAAPPESPARRPSFVARLSGWFRRLLGRDRSGGG